MCVGGVGDSLGVSGGGGRGGGGGSSHGGGRELLPGLGAKQQKAPHEDSDP